MKQLLPGICSAITFYIGIVSKNNVYWAIVYFHLSVRTANLSHVLQFGCQNKQHSLLFSWQSLVRFVEKIYIQGVSKRALQLTGIVYLDMLQEFLIPQLDEDDQAGRIHFQQDGAPPHYLGEVREYLNRSVDR